MVHRTTCSLIYCASAVLKDVRTLSTSSFLNSLRIFLYRMHIPSKDTNCQIIAEIVSLVSDFCFSFRQKHYQRLPRLLHVSLHCLSNSWQSRWINNSFISSCRLCKTGCIPRHISSTSSKLSAYCLFQI
jgi:hypothetical protein